MKDNVERDAYQRPISAVEWWFLAQPSRLSPVIQTVIEGTGTLTVAELDAAVAIASAANPGSRLRRRGRIWVDSGVPPRVRVVAGRPDGARVSDIDALHDPLPGADGALCEVLWCSGSPTVLVFRASHAIMDGQGKSMWVADVFRVLRGLPPLGATATTTEADVSRRLDGRLTEAVPDLWAPSPLALPVRSADARRTGWARRTVDGYHPALVAKVATALTDVFGLDSARFAVTFDLRRHVPEARTTGNLAQVEMFDVAASEPWEAMHERLLSTMAEGRYASWDLDGKLLKVPLRVLRTLVRFAETAKGDQRAACAAISHLGRVELEQLCAPSFEAHALYMCPLLGAMGSPDLSLVEFGGRTEMTLAWRAGPGMAERADAVLEQLAEVLSPARLRSWPGNDTGRAPADRTVVDLFRARVSHDPQAVALRWPDGELSFAELDHRSEVTAARLVALGVGRESVVGLLSDRSAEALVGLWGVLKAGAAYLPLDPQHPDQRLTSLLEDAGAAACLVQRGHAERRVAPDGCHAIVIDELPFGQPQPPVLCDPRPEDLAYLIYTSGSTGTPKGVEIEHRALANYVDWATERFQVDDSTNFAVFSSLAFDLPNTALYLSILAGATLVLIPEEPNHLSLRYLLERSGANALKLTPSHLELIGNLDLRPIGFSLLVVGGEPLRPEVAARARSQFGSDCRIFNHYGPTEATIGCVLNPYLGGHDGSAVVPIGRPAGNCQVYLLDSDRRFVAAGEIGEMYLGGAQLARGYRGRPELTRERFAGLADGSRVYRSGDLARVLPSGELEFLGRADDQVKVMGHRVEPAETVRALEEHPRVRRAVVLVRPAPNGAKALCAYVVLDQPVAVSALMEFLAERLPRYLIPATLGLVEGFTQTANGKIDLRSLPDPFDDVSTLAPVVAEAPDDVRDAIARVWASTLQVDAGQIDSASDFHQLGGNSALLLAMLAAVSNDVIGAAGERVFMSKLGQIIRRPTLEQVSELARHARDAVQAGV